MKKYILTLILALFIIPLFTYAQAIDVGQLNIQYTFIGSYSLPASYTIIQKLSGGGQQTEGGTSNGNPGYIHNIDFAHFESNTEEYHVIFQPASPFILQMSDDCEGQVPLAGKTKTCLATFRLPSLVSEPTLVSIPTTSVTPTIPSSPAPISTQISEIKSIITPPQIVQPVPLQPSVVSVTSQPTEILTTTVVPTPIITKPMFSTTSMSVSVLSPTVIAINALTKPIETKTKNSADIMNLQKLLATDKTIYPDGTINGFYGPKTIMAVKKFQKKYGLPQVGQVGPATLAKMKEIFGASSVPTPILTSTLSTTTTALVAQTQQIETQIKAIQEQIKTLLKK